MRTLAHALLPSLVLLFLAVASDGAELRAMSFNIRNSNAKDGEDHWTHRSTMFVATIRAYDPDLLGLQEVTASQRDFLIQHFPDYTAVGVARDDPARGGEWSLALIRTQRFEILESGDFWLSETPEVPGSRSWDAAYPRICTWARVREREGGREVLFANTHFDHKGALARTESARLLRTRLPGLARGAAVILAGDFNCTESSEVYRVLLDADAPVRLLDAYRVVHPVSSSDEATFHAFTGRVNGARIDWILYTAPFQPTAAEIIRTSDGRRYPSDHFAVTASFRFP